MALDKEYWNNRYQTGQIGWDLGDVSPALAKYFDQTTFRSQPILIPGCGNAYEAEYLHTKGFNNVHIIDVSEQAIHNFKKRCPTFPETHIHHQNFFDHQGSYTLIIEQTFFCAIHPEKRKEYRNKMHQLLQPNGKLVGLLFTIPIKETPPFGGSLAEYQELFSTYFTVNKMEPCYLSHPSRKGVELFINLRKA